MSGESSLAWAQPQPRARSAAPARANTPILALVAALSVLALSTGFTMWLGEEKQLLKPVYVYSAICAMGLLYALYMRPLTRTHGPIIFGLLAYALLCSSQVLYAETTETYLLYDRLTFVFITVALFSLFSRLGDLTGVLNAFRVSVLFCAAAVVYEFLTKTNPYRDLYFGRPGGLVGNPNAAAMYIAMSLPIMVWRTSPLVKAFFYVATLAGVLGTFSRSGLILWATAALLPVLLPSGRPMTAQHMVMLVACALLALLVYLNYGAFTEKISHTSSALLTTNTEARLGTLQDYSVWERFYVLKLGFEAFLKHPLLGNGVGYGNHWDYRVSVHNQILQALMEQGLVGVIWLVGFMASLLAIRKPFGVRLLILFVIASEFTHNFFDQPISGALLAMYGLIGSRHETPMPPAGPAPLSPHPV